MTADPLTITDDSGPLTLHATADATQGDADLTITAAGGVRSHDMPLSLLTMGLPGTLDRSFHPNGILDQPASGRSSGIAIQPELNAIGVPENTDFDAVAVQPDGGIVVAGSAQTTATDSSAVVVRLAPTGTLDSSFGVTNGRTIVPDGFADYEALVARFRPDGLLDLGFAGGFVTHNFSGGDARDIIGRIAFDTEGRIVAAGVALDPSFVPRVILARFWP